MMETFGVKSQWKGNVITVHEGNYVPTDFTVEADWSAASYWFEVVALNPNSEVVLKGLKRYSEQGDSKVAELFERLGVDYKFTQNGLVLKNSGKLNKKFVYDFIEQPDLAQTFAVTCCCLGIPFEFTGLQTLKIKETDRINALIDELRKMGYVLNSNQVDNLIWNGEKDKADDVPCISTYKDHRMAMAFAPAVSIFGNMIVDDPEVVSKSYPKYWSHLKEYGYLVEED